MYKINYSSQAIFSNFIYNKDFTHDANISRLESFFKRTQRIPLMFSPCIETKDFY